MLLAVDSSTKWIGLALYDGASVLGEMVWKTNNHHTVELAPAIESLLKRCDLSVKELKVLAVALGPGSFTSLRIGLAVVKGMALSLRIPVIGVPTLDVLVASQPPSELPMAAALQAGRSRYAVMWYKSVNDIWESQSEAKVFRLAELVEEITQPTLVCGEFTEEDQEILRGKQKNNIVLVSPVQSLRRPAYLAQLAWKRWKKKDVDDVVTLSPIYLHVAGSIPA